VNRKVIVSLIALVLLAFLIAGCAEPEEIEVTRIVTEEVEKVVEVTRIVTEVQEVEVTRVVPADAETVSAMSLSALAKSIQDGEIDVGDEFGMAEDQRFHVIHSDVVDMSCTQCHVQEAPLEVAQPLNISDEAPGPVDRRVCLGCHLTGPATKLYEPKE
jgi:hypothetical protein